MIHSYSTTIKFTDDNKRPYYFEGEDFLAVSPWTATPRIVLDFSSIAKEETAFFIHSNPPDFLKNSVFKPYILALRYRGSSLEETALIALLEPFLNYGYLPNLEFVEISHLTLPDTLLKLICTALNPKKVLSVTIKHLSLIKCKLGTHSTIEIFNSFHENIVLKELNLNGNNCGDKALSFLSKCLLESRNNIRILHLGGNNFTDKGIFYLHVFCF